MTEALLAPAPRFVPLRQSSAFELLCACSVAHPNLEQIERIQAHAEHGGAQSGYWWEEFRSLAEHHGVLPLAAYNLIEHTLNLPPETRRSLTTLYAENLRRNLWFAAELLRILRHFEVRQIRALPYKGPVLAQAAYGDLGLRSFSDLDILIAPSDFFRAKQALAEIEYHPAHQLAPAVERLWLRAGYEQSFDGPAGKNLLELQWRLLPYFYAIDPNFAHFRFDDLWARTGRIELGASTTPAQIRTSTHAAADSTPCLSPEDSLLAVCLHAAKHLWTRLIWVADIAESLRAPQIDLTVVISRARSLGIARILGVSFRLAEDLLGATIPPAAREVMEGDPEVPRLAQHSASRLQRAASYDFESTDYFRQTARLRERRADRGRYLWRLAWTPGPKDVEAVQLPGGMFSLYPAIRIARLLKKLACG